MPWEHCGQPLLDDADACPACGAAKTSWTVDFDVTRTFKVGQRPIVKLGLEDAGGQPVAGAEYEVRLPGGGALTGRLDEHGYAKVVLPGPDPCVVRFPDRRVVRLPDAAGGAVERGDDGAFSCAPRVKTYAFRLDGRRVRLRLKEPTGELLAGARWSVELPGAPGREGTSDDQGVAEVEVPDGATEGHLAVWRGERLALCLRLRFGAPPPLDELAGGQARLAALGFFPGALDGELGPRTRSALARFQRAHGLAESGAYDEATKGKLRDLAR
jgi:hypothetical protein